MAILKLLHVFAVFVWVGCLLTLSGCLSYQASKTPGDQRKLGKMLKRAYLAIDLPAMIMSLTLGVLSFFIKKVEFKPWLHMKLTFVFFLILCDLYVARKIFLHRTFPVQKKKKRYKAIQGIACLSFLAILVAVYVIKKPA